MGKKVKTARQRELANRKAVAARRRKKPASSTKKPAARSREHGKARSAKVTVKALSDIGGPRRMSVLPRDVIVGKRHRKDMGDIDGLARLIEEAAALAGTPDSGANGLLQPIGIRPDKRLIFGGRRLLAWQRSKFRDQPIPCSVIPIEQIVRGEHIENVGRKDFAPSEIVAIKRDLDPLLKKEAKERQRRHGGTAPGRKKHSGEISHSDGGRAVEHLARLVGKDRKTIEKAEVIVDAAERDPEKFGPLKEDMDRTGKVDGPFKRLQVIQQTEAIRAAPPPLPMQGPYSTVVVDFPWPAEDKDQDAIDAAGRSFRGYPEMSIKSICGFATTKIAPLLAHDVSVWLWVPNFHLGQGYAHHVIGALGFTGRCKTILTWTKDRLGRGQILRDRTEQCMLLQRGKPAVNVYGEDPPTTALLAPRRENSRKPDEFYRLVERVTPATRYASFFSRGGEGELWDCHGDEVGKFAKPANSGDRPAAETVQPPAAAENNTEAQCAPAGLGETAPADASPASEQSPCDQGDGAAGRPIQRAGRPTNPHDDPGELPNFLVRDGNNVPAYARPADDGSESVPADAPESVASDGVS